MGLCSCKEGPVVEVIGRKYEVCAALGKPMPYPGYGTFLARVGGETKAAVRDAICVGYRHIDCAQVYSNEKEVGEGIQEGLSLTGLSREDIYITSKVWNTHRRAEHVHEALKQTLADLNCGYLDLYLIHWPQSYKYLPKEEANPGVNCVAPVVNGAALSPEFFPMIFQGPTGKHPGGGDGKLGAPPNDCVYPPNGVDFAETWGAMEELVDRGLVRAIGVSNFTPRQMDALLEKARLPIACNQVEHHPYLQQLPLKEYCRQKKIQLVGYATLLNPSLQKEKSEGLWQEPAVMAVAKKHNKSVPQVLIRWGFQSGVVPLVKSVSRERLKENLLVHDFQLSEDDMESISSLECGWRHNTVPSGGVASAFAS